MFKTCRKVVFLVALHASLGLGQLRAEPSVFELNPEIKMARSEAGRGFLKYIVQCAVEDGRQVHARHDGKDYYFPGGLGILPDWTKRPLKPGEQRWLTACVLAHVNALGEHVLISSRGPLPQLIRDMSAAELKSHSVEEGAFFGNMFADEPKLYACRGRDDLIRSVDGDRRLCTLSANPNCQMELLGRCEEVCEKRDPRWGFYQNCRAGDRVYEEVVTTYLRGR